LEYRLWTSKYEICSINYSKSYLGKMSNSTLPINVSRFTNEINALIKLKGLSGVMPLLDYDLKGNKKWYLMPKMQTFNVKFIQEKNLDIRSVLEFYLSISKTLCEIHRQGYFHRDIKPDNLFIQEDKAIIGDFGLVKVPEGMNLTPAGKKLGPHFFIAPEMLANANEHKGDKADVYSLSKSLWCSLVKQEFPIPGEYSLDFKPFWVNELLDRKDLIGLDLLLRKAMVINPMKR
jgi:serine/threonine protein kinase